MRRTNLLLPLSAALGVLAIAGFTAAADANLDEIDVIERPISTAAAARRLAHVSDALAKAQGRMVRLIDAEPSALPPDPCDDPNAVSCNEVQAVESIDAQAESFLSDVAALDHGADRAALRRRLSYATATSAFSSVRLQSLTSDWAEARPEGRPPSESPPDPCTPAIISNIDLVTRSAEFADRRIGTIDSCTEPASMERRLGHVVTGLAGSIARLDALAAVGFNPQPDPPLGRVAEDLDAIIVRAEYLARTARALKASSSEALIFGEGAP